MANGIPGRQTAPAMNFAFRSVSVVLALGCLAMARKPSVSVRFYAETNARDSEAFARPITLHHPEREAYVEKVPSINEQNIKGMFPPFQAADGSWGAAFQLDNKGRIDLEVVSTERRGQSMVVFVVTKGGAHQVIDMLIDKPVRDGIITIPRGLTEMEVKVLAKEYKLIGPKRK